MAEANTKALAQKVSDVLHDKPELLDRFMSHPQDSITKITGNNNLSASDMGGILDLLLSGSNKDSGLLGDIVGALIKSKTTNSGERNVVGELIGKVIGNDNSKDIITAVLGSLLGQSGSKDAASSSTTKSTSTKTTGTKTTGTKTTGTKTTGTKTTGTKTTGTKTTGTKSTSTKSTSAKSSTQEKSEGGLLDVIGGVLDSNNDGSFIDDIIGSILKAKKQ